MKGNNGITLQRALEDLGNNSEEVYQTLKDLGIRGERHDFKCCPVANYFKSLGFITPAATPVNISVGDWKSMIGEHETLPCPRGVAAFIRAFDDLSAYTDLRGSA